MTTLRTLMLATLLLVALTALAHADVTKEPGYFDLEWIQIPDDADEIQDIDLTPMLLAMAKDAEEEDQALLEALSMVRSIRVKAWSTDYRDEKTDQAVERITTQLKKDGWKRLIYVKDSDETVIVNARYVDDDMVGLVLVAHEPGESAAFVNVVGDLDLVNLFKLAAMIDSEELDEMMESHVH